MAQKINERPPNKAVRVYKDPLRLTALLYLKEALLTERYEDCAEIIFLAREFGAQKNEIHYLLEDPRRNPVS